MSDKNWAAALEGALDVLKSDLETWRADSLPCEPGGPTVDPKDADVIVRGMTELLIQVFNLKQELSKLQNQNSELMFKIRCVAQALK